MYKNITGDLLQIVKVNTWQDQVIGGFPQIVGIDNEWRASVCWGLMGTVPLWDELCRQSIDVWWSREVKTGER